MREWTTFDQQADAWGFAVAYPDGYGGCWADGRGVTTADEAGVDDVAFLRAIIDWVVAWTVFGGGHAWPGSARVPGAAQMTTQEFDAAEEICRFAAPLLASADARRL
jgi:poly(3-hydroxybutyrate) depolymerase